MLSLACEYRVMQPKFSIGLNETVLGLPVPRWLQTTMSKVIGERLSEIACTTGKLYSAEQALEVSLILIFLVEIRMLSFADGYDR